MEIRLTETKARLWNRSFIVLSAAPFSTGWGRVFTRSRFSRKATSSMRKDTSAMISTPRITGAY